MYWDSPLNQIIEITEDSVLVHRKDRTFTQDFAMIFRYFTDKPENCRTISKEEFIRSV